MKGTLFISLRRLRPVCSPYESLALGRKGVIKCIFVYVAISNRFQIAFLTSQIYWYFKVRIMCVLFSSYFLTKSFVMCTVCYPIKHPSIRDVYYTTYFAIFISGSRSHTQSHKATHKKILETYDRMPSRRVHTTPLVRSCVYRTLLPPPNLLKASRVCSLVFHNTIATTTSILQALEPDWVVAGAGVW